MYVDASNLQRYLRWKHSPISFELETTFRECFCDSDRVMQLAKYMCRISDTLTRNFYEATCDSSVTDAVRDPVLGDVIKLFFKIRCQSFTENRSLVSGKDTYCEKTKTVAKKSKRNKIIITNDNSTQHSGV